MTNLELPMWLQNALRSETGVRCKRILRLQLRQLPCLQTVFPKSRCLKRSRYQTVGQEEEDDGGESEDKRQRLNLTLGRSLMRLSLMIVVVLTGVLMFRKPKTRLTHLSQVEAFDRDAPLILYIGAIEILICGACAHTAAVMYKRRVHAMRHPSDATEKEREKYVKVCLQKEPGREEEQLYGLNFRPSTDGLECLLVEAVRKGSLVEKWNAKCREPTPEEILEAALGDDAEPSGEASSDRKKSVQPGAAIVAVNEVTGDTGMMQLQLMKPKVVLWVRPDVLEVLQPGIRDAEYPEYGGEPPVLGIASGATPAEPSPEPAPRPEQIGAGEEEGWSLSSQSRTSPSCACIGLEDEEPQILMRWLVCSLLTGWVTLLPVLLVQPHEERPRQQLFRKYLLKPSLILLPLVSLLWLLDCLEVAIQHQILPPSFYFVTCHMLVPAVLAYHLMQLQVADEALVLDQRKTRQEEMGSAIPAVAEDPPPTFLRELLTVNPVALVWISSCAAIPIVLASMVTPMQTDRARLAQGYVNVVYGPCILFQVGAGYVFYHLRFYALPSFYFQGIATLVTLPCFVVWSLCLFCASHYGRRDAAMVELQRKERAKEALKKAGRPVPEGSTTEGSEGQRDTELVDCSEAASKDWDLVYSA